MRNLFNFTWISLPRYISLYIGGHVISCKYAKRSLWVIQQSINTNKYIQLFIWMSRTLVIALSILQYFHSVEGIEILFRFEFRAKDSCNNMRVSCVHMLQHDLHNIYTVLVSDL